MVDCHRIITTTITVMGFHIVTTLGGAEKVLTPAERWRGLSNSWRPLDSGLGGRRRAPTMRNRVVRDPKLQRGRELGVSQPEGRDNS